MRRIAFGGPEHQSRETHALHTHAHDKSGQIMVYGNGATVMHVLKRRGAKPTVEVLGEDGHNAFGGEFCYSDYFLPEELA